MLTEQASTPRPEALFHEIDVFSAHVDLPCTLDALTQLSAWCQSLAGKHGLSEGCIFRLELVLAEAITNIVQHAGADPAGDFITVHFGIRHGWVVVRVEDSGRPFDPTTAPEHQQPVSLEDARIGGLGVHLMRAYTQQIEYHRVDNKNQLWMTLPCDG